MYRSFEKACRPLRDDLIRFVERLNSSVHPGFGGEGTAQQIQEMFERLGFDLTLRDEAGNVIGVFAGSTDGPTLLLETCADIAQRGQGTGRETDRQAAQTRKSCFRGRGIAHQAAVAAQLFGSYILNESPFPFCGNLVVAATLADCNGWGTGTDHLVRVTLSKLGLKPRLAILGEPTGLDLFHGGPGRVEFLCRIPKDNGRPVRLLSRDIGDSVTDGMSISEMQRSSSEAELAVTIACRIPPGSNVGRCRDRITRRIQAAVGANARAGINVEVHHRRQRLFNGTTAEVLCAAEPWSVDCSDAIVRRARKALSAAHWNGRQLRTWSMDHWKLGAAGSVLARRHDIPTLCFGPGETRLVNSSCESVGYNAAYKATQGFAELAHAILGSPRPTRIAA